MELSQDHPSKRICMKDVITNGSSLTTGLLGKSCRISMSDGHLQASLEKMIRVQDLTSTLKQLVTTRLRKVLAKGMKIGTKSTFNPSDD